MHSLLIDADLEKRLQDDGFAVLPILSPDEVATLVAVWHRLSMNTDPLYDPTGMTATVRQRGMDVDADAAIRSVVSGPLKRHLVASEPFMSAFLVKRPGSDELPAHLDFRLADEPRSRTFGCWIPLTPADRATGALGVAPGSHLLVDFDRTPADPGHEWTEHFIGDGARTTVLDIEPGTAVIYDHRLVHFSLPNTSDAPRIAVNIGIARDDECDAARSLLLQMMGQGMSGVDVEDPVESVSGPDDVGRSTSELAGPATGRMDPDASSGHRTSNPERRRRFGWRPRNPFAGRQPH